MEINFRPIMPSGLQKRLLRQNSGKVTVHSHQIRVHSVGCKNEFFFHLLRVEFPREETFVLPGVRYRVSAYEAAFSIFPIGRLDYRIVESSFAENQFARHFAVMDTRHETTVNDRVAVRVMDDARKQFRGIGRSLFSVAMNHVASMGIPKVYLHNVLDYRFFKQLSISARVVEVIHEDAGPIPLSDFNPRDKNVIINMEMKVTNEKNLPRIQIGLRSDRTPIID